MLSLREFVQRVRGVFARSQSEAELEEELRSHLEMLVEDNIRKGISLAEARRVANHSLGGLTQTREAWLEQKGLPIVETTIQDLRYGLRMLRKNPGFGGGSDLNARPGYRR